MHNPVLLSYASSHWKSLSAMQSLPVPRFLIQVYMTFFVCHTVRISTEHSLLLSPHVSTQRLLATMATHWDSGNTLQLGSQEL